MLFGNSNSDCIRDNLIKLVEAAAYCLNVLGQKDLPSEKQIESAYKEISEAMASIIDGGIAAHSEYDYILYRARLKLRMINPSFVF